MGSTSQVMGLVQLSVRVDPDLKDRLTRVVEQRDETIQDAVDQALRSWLVRREPKAAAAE